MAEIGEARVAQKMPQVNAEIEQLQREIDCVRKEFTALAEKLTPILRVEPMEAGVGKDKAITLVPIAEQLRKFVENIRLFGKEIKSVQNRIEI